MLSGKSEININDKAAANVNIGNQAFDPELMRAFMDLSGIVCKDLGKFHKTKKTSETYLFFDEVDIESLTNSLSVDLRIHNPKLTPVVEAIRDMNFPRLKYLIENSVLDSFPQYGISIFAFLSAHKQPSITDEYIEKLNSFNLKVFDFLEGFGFTKKFVSAINSSDASTKSNFRDFILKAIERSLKQGNFSYASFLIFNSWLSPYKDILDIENNDDEKIYLLESTDKPKFLAYQTMDNFLNIFHILKFFQRNKCIDLLKATTDLVKDYPKISKSIFCLHVKREDISFFEFIKIFAPNPSEDYIKFCLKQFVSNKSLVMLMAGVLHFKPDLIFDNQVLLKLAIQAKWVQGCEYFLKTKLFTFKDDDASLIKVIGESNFEYIIRELMKNNRKVLASFDNYIFRQMVKLKNYPMIQDLLSVPSVNIPRATIHDILYVMVTRPDYISSILKLTVLEYKTRVLKTMDKKFAYEMILSKAIDANDKDLFEFTLNLIQIEKVDITLRLIVNKLLSDRNSDFLFILSRYNTIEKELITYDHLESAIRETKVDMLKFVISFGALELDYSNYRAISLAYCYFNVDVFKLLLEQDIYKNSNAISILFELVKIEIDLGSTKAIDILMELGCYKPFFLKSYELYYYALQKGKPDIAKLISSFNVKYYQTYLSAHLAAIIIREAVPASEIGNDAESSAASSIRTIEVPVIRNVTNADEIIPDSRGVHDNRFGYIYPSSVNSQALVEETSQGFDCTMERPSKVRKIL